MYLIYPGADPELKLGGGHLGILPTYRTRREVYQASSSSGSIERYLHSYAANDLKNKKHDGLYRKTFIEINHVLILF